MRMWLIPLAGVLAGALAGANLALGGVESPWDGHPRISLDQPDLPERFLAEHNRERARIGEPVLEWDAGLAVQARAWAVELARRGVMIHSADGLRSDEGENLFTGTAAAYSPEEMIDSFVEERADFVPGVFPAVARDGDWTNVGHYTQLIWRGTRRVGCGVARGGGQDFLVCRYWPQGNVVGAPVP